MRLVSHFALMAVLVVVLGACARKEPQPAQPDRAAVPPPASSPLAKVQVGMSAGEVEALLGPPTEENAYVTGKAFIPFYYGSDRTRRAYFYKGLGRVVFAGSGGWVGANHKVTRVEYDPNETGRAK